MRFKLYFGQKPTFHSKDCDSFSQKKYSCQLLMLTPKGMPVAVLRNRDWEEGGWKVQHGFSSVYFRTFAETMDYCRQHFCDLHGKPLKK